MIGFSGKRPSTIGPKAGLLRPCPGTPNCVCSHDQGRDGIPPLTFTDSKEAALQRLEKVLLSMDGCRLITRSDKYLHAEFRTRWLGFVDDFEAVIQVAPAESTAMGELHVRSASRLGHSDFGVNRKRVERIRTQFNQNP